MGDTCRSRAVRSSCGLRVVSTLTRRSVTACSWLKRSVLITHYSLLIASLLGCGIPIIIEEQRTVHLIPLEPPPNGRWELFWTSLDGGRVQRLTEPMDRGRSPAWSPDGSKIAFISERNKNGEIYIVNQDGLGWKQLTFTKGEEDDPEWSPDGSKIIFTSDRSGNWEIYTIKPDGTEETRLTFTDGDSINPAWSPNGREISYVTNQDGNWEIYTMMASGSQPRRLTTHPSKDGFAGMSGRRMGALLCSIRTETVLFNFIS